MGETLKTYSVLIAWSDGDGEQGEFGDIVRARSSDHAERIVRARMMRTQWDEAACSNSPMTKREVADNYATSFLGKRRYFGRVLDCHEGAIWKAAELEKALRDLLTQCDLQASLGGWVDLGEREAARKIIAEIDGF